MLGKLHSKDQPREQRNGGFSDRFFYAYLGIIVWAPLPKASIHPWASNLLSMMCLLIAASMLLEALRKQMYLQKTLRQHRLALVMLGLVPLWVSVQALPLPPAIIGYLSPLSLQLQSFIVGDFYTLSLESAITKQMALLSWAFWLFFVMSLLLIDSAKRLRTVIYVVVFCGVFQALFGSFMTLSGLELGFFVEKEFYLGRATGTFVNRNHLAGYLEMSLALGIGLLVASLGQEKSKDWRAHARKWLETLLGPKMRLRVYLAIMVIALVLTRSRMGNTAFFVSLPLCGLLMMVLQRKLSRGPLILFASLLLVDVLIVGQWFGFEELAERLQNTSAETENRDELNVETWQLFQAYPVAGTGAGTFYSSFPQQRTAEITGFNDHAHNDYLEFASGFGIIGVIPLGLSILLALQAVLKTLIKRRNKLMQGVAFGCLMGIFSLLIHSIVDFNLQMPANGLLFVLLLALSSIALNLDRRSSRSAR